MIAAKLASLDVATIAPTSGNRIVIVPPAFATMLLTFWGRPFGWLKTTTHRAGTASDGAADSRNGRVSIRTSARPKYRLSEVDIPPPLDLRRAGAMRPHLLSPRLLLTSARRSRPVAQAAGLWPGDGQHRHIPRAGRTPTGRTYPLRGAHPPSSRPRGPATCATGPPWASQSA